MWPQFEYSIFIFRSKDALILTQTKIEAPVALGGAGLDLQNDVTSQKLAMFFPAHQRRPLYDLCQTWANFKVMLSPGLLSQPIDAVNEYFGCQIALYFAFLGHYTNWLAPAAIVGLGCFIAQLVQGKANLK